MATNENSQNTFTKINVTTNSLTFFDENGVMLKLSFFDETYSIMMCEPTLTNEGKKKYPAESRISFIITADRIASLYNNIVLEKVIPAIAEKRNYDGGIFLDNKRKDRVFCLKVQDNEVYAIYYGEIDADRHPKKTKVFKFTKSPIIEKYNPESGEFAMEDAHAQFLLFVKTLEGFLLAVSSINTHMQRYTNKWSQDKIFKMLEEMAIKLGVTVAPPAQPFGNQGQQQSYGGDGMPPMTETDNLNNLLMG